MHDGTIAADARARLLRLKTNGQVKVKKSIEGGGVKDEGDAVFTSFLLRRNEMLYLLHLFGCVPIYPY
jgi:hypothetical protein